MSASMKETDFPCDTCKARPGESCRTAGGLPVGVHLPRVLLYGDALRERLGDPARSVSLPEPHEGK